MDRILLFPQSVHAMYETMTDYRQCGLAQAHPNNELINELSSTSHSIAVTGR